MQKYKILIYEKKTIVRLIIENEIAEMNIIEIEIINVNIRISYK
jgi:hypothetical protein